MEKKVYEVISHETIGYALTYCVDRAAPSVLYHKKRGEEVSAVGMYRFFFLIDRLKGQGSNKDFTPYTEPTIGKARYVLVRKTNKDKRGLMFEDMYSPRFWFQGKQYDEIYDLYFNKIKEDSSIAYQIIKDAIIVSQNIAEGVKYNPNSPSIESPIVMALTLDDFVNKVFAHMDTMKAKGFSGFSKTMIEYLNIDTVAFLNGLMAVELK